MTDDILTQNTTIPARDGFTLAATVFAPAERGPKGAVLINSATAVPRKIYRAFASYLAARGFAVLTYDYRGTAGSRPLSLKGFAARMRDWAALDVAGAIDHVRQVWPLLPLTVVGHSFGGQAVGLVSNNNEIARALLVASQSGYWRHYAGLEKYRVWLLFRLIAPPIVQLAGYAPGRLGIGEDLPQGVFREWAAWCLSPGFFFDDPSLAATENFPRYGGRLRAIGLDDDPWATPAAIDALLRHFRGTEPEHVHIHPREVGARKIGHFGFFRLEHRDTLWRDAAEWIGAEGA